jgi:hypothetical protein
MMTHHHYKDERFNSIQNKLLLPLDLNNVPNFKHVLPALFANWEKLFENKKTKMRSQSERIFRITKNYQYPAAN